MTLYEELTAAGIKTDCHESDLYFPATPEALEILKRYPDQSYSFFTSNIEGNRWVDCPFAYDVWWTNRGMK